MKHIYQFIITSVLLCTTVLVSAQIPSLNSYPASNAVIYLDFDGQTVDGTSWNTSGPIVCGGSGMTSAQITEVFNRVSEDYRPFNVNVTTDSTKYWSASSMKRMRIIFTVSSAWYGPAGGVSYINSFSWGDNTPAFVFSALLNYNPKSISEAASHEAGHTLGLRHQAAYDGNCVKTAEYHSGIGSGEISWAPIMGVGYSKNLTLWNYGANPYGCTNIQDDLSIITNSSTGIGFRNDDHSNMTTGASVATFNNNLFTVGGIIERNNDIDVVNFTVPSNGRFRLDAVPFNVGNNNTGSNIDMQVELLDVQQLVMGTYNPPTSLSAAIDIILNPGTYYLRVKGMGNVNAPNYASLGSYTLNGTFTANSALPLHKLELKGNVQNSNHKLNWEIVADEALVEQEIEVSADGKNFESIGKLATTSRSLNHTPAVKGIVYYRLNVTFDNGRQYYSNVISLKNNDGNAKPFMVGNIVQNTIAISSPSMFSYSVFDFNGRMMMKGNLTQGMNTISMPSASTGMYIMQYHNGQQLFTEKFLKR